MRIAIITRFRNYPPNDFPGGDETVHRKIASLLTERGHTVEFIGMDTAMENGFGNRFERMFSQRFFLFGPSIIGKYFRTVSHNYDLVIANGEYGAFVDHPKTVILFHFSTEGYTRRIFSAGHYLRNLFNPRMYSQTLFFWRKKGLEKKAGKGRRVVAVSDYVSGWLAKQGVSVHSVIPNSIDAKDFFPAPVPAEGKTLLFVGRNDYYGKGFDILEKIAARGWNIDCYTNRKSKPGDPLNCLGVVTAKDMPSLYRRYPVLVFPSRYESCPMVPLEAMASGLPVVMSDVGYAALLRKEIPEFVVDLNRECAASFDQNLRTILEHRDEFAEKARNFVSRHFGYPAFRDRWIDVAENWEGEKEPEKQP